VAIDDFGTGYSSLGRLAMLPVDTLKVDRSFIHGIEENASDRAIVKTIIARARSLNMTTVAEGVETEEQLARLKTMKCDQVQGYLFSNAVPSQAVPELILRLNSVAAAAAAPLPQRSSLARQAASARRC
jgi:EAL domain-containing protein (putative c-di-GMP-specific phosphodiesterase class I)